MLDELGLKRHVKGRGAATPQCADGKHCHERRCGRPHEQQGHRHAGERDSQEREAMPIEQAAKQPASEQTRAAKRRQRHGNGARIDVRDLRQEGLDIAVACVIAGRHEDRDCVERDEERVLEQLGQLFDCKALTRRHGREHRCLVDDRDG